MYVENLEINNSLKWALFIKVSGQITSNTLWKRGEVFFLRIWRIFLFLRALVNIPIQTLIISPWPLLRKMIVSRLELGPPVVTFIKSANQCSIKQCLIVHLVAVWTLIYDNEIIFEEFQASGCIKRKIISKNNFTFITIRRAKQIMITFGFKQ